MKLVCKLKAAAILFPLSLASLSGQEVYLKDTVMMNAVEISVPRSFRNTPFLVTNIETESLIKFKTDDIGSLLRYSTSLSVKRNGNSGLASVSMRGMSSTHTGITWNGISITGPSTGMSDFALIPVCAASSVYISAGGADLNGISGSLGGKVDLISAPEFGRESEGSLVLGAGSYDKYSLMFSLKLNNDKISSKSSIWGRTAENNFAFNHETGQDSTEILHRTNSSYNNWGLIQDIYYKFGRSILSAHVWYNDSERNLPGQVDSVQNNYGESQSDNSLRAVVNFNNRYDRLDIDLTTGYTQEKNLYFNDSLPFLNGDNGSSALTAKAKITYKISENAGFTLNLSDEYQSASSLAYTDTTEKRNLLSSSLAIHYAPLKRLKFTVQARQVLADTNFVLPEYTIGAAFMVSQNGKHILKANYSRNINLPCLNDLYWSYVGNPDLRPEISKGGEVGYSFSIGGQNNIRAAFDMTVFASTVRDLIQWLPDESFSIWSPVNIMAVRLKGGEARLTTTIPIDHGKISAGASYSLTSSVVSTAGTDDDPSIGKQLTYIPFNHFSANLSGSYYFLRGGLLVAAESKRFITSDNSEYLPAACIVDANIGTTLSMGRTSFLIDLAVENILNTEWESVKNYPMPMRTFMLSIKANFSLSSGKHKLSTEL